MLRQAAYEDGFAAGHSEGLSKGEGEVQTQAHRLRALIASLARPLEQLDARVEEELVALVIALVRQLVRREIRTEPGVIVAAIREAVAVLPQSAREVAVKVHPEDAALLREVYSEHLGEDGPGWRLVESPAVTRGGCVVVTSTSEVDATVERRLAAMFRHVFGGDRLSDAPAAGDAIAGAGDQRADGTRGEPGGLDDGGGTLQ
jgi:flagellar assembly protein FliH